VIVGILGIDTSSIVAVIASAGFAIGLAFQGSLSNFAGGVLLLVMKPFKVGDFIESEGQMGTVHGIKILYTEIITVDNQVVYVPNGKLSNASITNYSALDTRRFELKFGAGYECDTDKVKEILKSIVQDHPKVLKDPQPFVRLSEHADSALIFTVRGWAKQEDFWETYFDMIETVKKKFDENEISIPYPQMDVHMQK
jgi:small conductance mechanosensitive channel